MPDRRLIETHALPENWYSPPPYCPREDSLLARSLDGLPDGLDELDVEYSPQELRDRGWEL